MSNPFTTLNIGMKALQTQKKSLDVTGHNIANANNENYSRQEAVHSATSPYPLPGLNSSTGAGQIGSGVKVAEIRRMRDQFIDGQIQEENQAKGQWSRVKQGLNRIESIMNEPSDNGLSTAFDQFWESLQDLSNNPEDAANRTTVKQRAKTLISTFHNIDDQLQDYKKSLNTDFKATVDNINSLGQRIADLNQQIKRVEISGDNPNDLMDKRTGLVKELSEKINVKTKVNKENEIKLSVSGINFVDGKKVNLLNIVESEDKLEDIVKFETLDLEAKINSGELKGIMEVRDNHITNVIDDLDNLAFNFIEKFNQQHRAGFSPGQKQTQSLQSNLEIDDINNNLGLEGEVEIYIDQKEDPEIVNIESSDSLETIKEKFDNITDINARIDGDNNLLIEGNNDSKIQLVNGEGLDNILTELKIGTGIDFFQGETAENIDLSQEINEAEGMNKIAAATVARGLPGDGSNAARLSDLLKKDKIIEDSSLVEYFQAITSNLGIEGQRASQMEDNQDLLVEQLENHQKNIAGVSLDEEMANMIKYQQAFNAAARIISNTNKMLDSLMSIIR